MDVDGESNANPKPDAEHNPKLDPKPKHNYPVIYAHNLSTISPHFTRLTLASTLSVLLLRARCTHLTKWLTKWLTICLAVDALLTTLTLG